jgi:hypothetical protein
LTKSVPSTPDKPFGIAADLNHDGVYSCNWNFTATGGEGLVTNIGPDPFQLHLHSDYVTPSTQDEWTVYNFTQEYPGLSDSYSRSELMTQISDWEAAN